MWRGSVESLHIAPDKSRPMTTVEAVRATAGRGLEGDRYAIGKGTYSNKPEEGRQVTLFEHETLEALRRDHGIVLEPQQTRRNVITRGVPLNHLVGRQFLIGDVRVEGMRLNTPCQYLETLLGIKGLFKALIHRSGLNCRILSDGEIRVGDVVQPAPATDSSVLERHASPACAMHEANPAYMGYMSVEETLAFLNNLLEAERAGAKGVLEMAGDAAGETGDLLRDVARDEARCCAMLSRHIVRLGGTASPATGTFLAKLRALESWDQRFALLERGQSWVVRRLREMLPRIRDDGLHRDLSEMLDLHLRNIDRCTRLTA